MRLCSSYLCGTGVGFSVERQYVSKLPEVPDTTLRFRNYNRAVKDSKEGWAKAYRQSLLSLLWAGEIPKWDVSKVSVLLVLKLKTFGGQWLVVLQPLD
jgi:ribonucleoside-triphosphate reductase